MLSRLAYLAAFIVCFAAAPISSQASDFEGEFTAQVRTFANCAGRMMAYRDHLALFGGTGVDAAEAARQAHIQILEALLEHAGTQLDGRRVFQWRIDARAAQSAVLSQSSFATEVHIRSHAITVAERHIDTCNRLILGA